MDEFDKVVYRMSQQGVANTIRGNCDGWRESSCCGARIILHDICSDCKEHCESQCEECEDKNECENYEQGSEDI